MANRHLSRSIVLQALFEWDFRNRPDKELPSILKRNNDEFSSGMSDEPFMKALIETILGKKEDLNTIIVKAAPDWPLDKIACVDRNVLRMGLAELLFADRLEVPAKVAINEAIELAKSYGGENSGRFVNGVLGAVYKEIGEPGKDEVSTKKKDIPYEEMPQERLCGAVVYGKHHDDIFLALVHDIFGHWTLSKGHIEEGEDLPTGVVRVIKNEMGLQVLPEEKIGENEYVASNPEKGKLRKQVVYFLASAPYVPLQLKKTGGLDEAKWFKLSDILDLNFYDDILPLITKAVSLLSTKQ
ncbi:MAG: transcription antitermination factor NusB [Patescibacteria group bacterium]